jgi:hypothetical protein
MTALDPITAASPTFINAVRHGMKDGAPFQVMPGRVRWFRWIAAAGFGSFVGVGALISGSGDITACALGSIASLGVFVVLADRVRS